MRTVAVVDANPKLFDGSDIEIIVEVTAVGIGPANAAVIPMSTRRTIALVRSPDASNEAVRLPSNAKIGDIVEVYCMDGNVSVYPPDSENYKNSVPSLPEFGGGVRIRKLTSDLWSIIS